MISIFCEWPFFHLLNMTMPCLSIRSLVSQHHPFLLEKNNAEVQVVVQSPATMNHYSPLLTTTNHY